MFDNGELFYVIVGLIVVATYAIQRFDEPSFPDQETLPHVVEPLKYLFLGTAYKRARRAYALASILLYLLLVLAGPSMISLLKMWGVPTEDVPVQAWAFLVALFLVGLIPNTNNKWISMVEVSLRRFVHSYFLVPDAIKQTIGALEDAKYDPPAVIREWIQSSVKAKLLDDLRLPADSLEHQWARATLILESLKPRDGASGPLRLSAFGPFTEDYQRIRDKYKALESDVAQFREDKIALSDEGRVGRVQVRRDLGKKEKELKELSDREEDIVTSLGRFLKLLHAYLSWGIQQQAKSEIEVGGILEDLGFHISRGSSRRVFFDAVLPATLIVGGITFVFWFVYDSAKGNGPATRNMVNGLTPAITASIMYGLSVFIALKLRTRLIEEKRWSQYSPKCFASIAILSGFVSWWTIIAATIASESDKAAISLMGIAEIVRSPTSTFPPGWAFLLEKIATALPWVLVGAAVSTLIAHRLAGDVRRTKIADRFHDALFLGGGLGLAAAFANSLQMSLKAGWEYSDGNDVPLLARSVAVGLAAVGCGMALGYMVPWIYRSGIVKPPDIEAYRKLRALLQKAQLVFSDNGAAQDWVFAPRDELGGVSPAEAIQHKNQINRVFQMLEGDALPNDHSSAIVPLSVVSSR